MTDHKGIEPWDDDGLTEIAQAVAKRRGWKATAGFMEEEELKIRWSHVGRTYWFQVSDYLRYAPEAVLTDLIDAIGARAEGEPRAYSDATRKWLIGELKEHELETYLQRHRAHAGADADLEALRPEGCTAALRFGPQGQESGSSYLFDVIIIREDLDAPGNEERIAELIAEEQEHLAEARRTFRGGSENGTDRIRGVHREDQRPR